MAGGISAGELKEFADFAASLTAISRPVVEKYFRKPLTIEAKDDASPVTIADRTIEAEIRAAIEKQFPDHGIIGEEGGAKEGAGDFIWVIDPIDGTRAFACGNPLFGTMIALCDGEGTPLIGVIDLPAMGQCRMGIEGMPTTLDGKPLTTAATSAINNARIATTALIHLGDRTPAFTALAAQCATTSYGGDCANYAHLAAGWCDIVAEANLAPHDILAAVPVIKGAGGILTGWDGTPITLNDFDGTALAAATPALHREAMKILGEV